jgi:hypothetical protein
LAVAEAAIQAVGGVTAETAFERIDPAAGGRRPTAAIARRAADADGQARLGAIAVLAGQLAAAVTVVLAWFAVATTADRALRRHVTGGGFAFRRGNVATVGRQATRRRRGARVAERGARFTALEKARDEAGVARAAEREILAFDALGIGAAPGAVGGARRARNKTAAAVVLAGQAKTATPRLPATTLPVAATTGVGRGRVGGQAEDAQSGPDQEAAGGAAGAGLAHAPREIVEALRLHRALLAADAGRGEPASA